MSDTIPCKNCGFIDKPQVKPINNAMYYYVNEATGKVDGGYNNDVERWTNGKGTKLVRQDVWDKARIGNINEHLQQKQQEPQQQKQQDSRDEVIKKQEDELKQLKAKLSEANKDTGSAMPVVGGEAPKAINSGDEVKPVGMGNPAKPVVK
jgi:hypothetical protein